MKHTMAEIEKARIPMPDGSAIFRFRDPDKPHEPDVSHHVTLTIEDPVDSSRMIATLGFAGTVQLSAMFEKVAKEAGAVLAITHNGQEVPQEKTEAQPPSQGD